MRLLAIAAAILLLLLACYWALLFAWQRTLLFPAPPLAGAPDRPADARPIWLETAWGKVEAWYLPPLGAAAGPAPVLLFTHGNGELIDYWPGAFVEPRRWGLAVVLVEYPGYGRSGGVPTQASVTAAAVAAFDWAREQPALDPTRIVAYGRSLGGGAATALAGERPVAALILESTFTSVRAFARRFGAPGLLVRDRFDNLVGVRRYDGPVLILHGERDEIVPITHAWALHAAQPASEFHRMRCGHNDCPRPWAVIRRFLGRHRLLHPRERGRVAPSN